MSLKIWGIFRGLEHLADAEREFDYHGVRTDLGEDGLDAFNALTELRLNVRRAVWENERSLLPSDSEVCGVIKRALRVLLDADCLGHRNDPNAPLCDALLRASATLHLVNDDDNDDGGDSAGEGPPRSAQKAEPLDEVLAEIIAGA